MFGVAGLRASLQPDIDRSGASRSANTFAAWSALFVLGHVTGGATMGSALGAIGMLLPASWLAPATVGLALLCVVLSMHEFGIARLPMPQLRRQVQRNWMLHRHWNFVAFGYGLQLGCGVATRIPSTTAYGVMGFALLSGTWWKGAVIMGVFGLLRSWAPVFIGSRITSPDSSMQYAMLFSANEVRIKTFSGAVLLAAAIVVVATSFWVAS